MQPCLWESIDIQGSKSENMMLIPKLNTTPVWFVTLRNF